MQPGSDVGVFWCAEGDAIKMYAGQASQRTMTGYGAYKEKDSVFLGSWVSGKLHGYGKASWLDGTVTYLGKWVNNECSGRGRFTDEHGARHDSFWFAGIDTLVPTDFDVISAQVNEGQLMMKAIA